MNPLGHLFASCHSSTTHALYQCPLDAATTRDMTGFFVILRVARQGVVADNFVRNNPADNSQGHLPVGWCTWMYTMNPVKPNNIKYIHHHRMDSATALAPLRLRGMTGGLARFPAGLVFLISGNNAACSCYII